MRVNGIELERGFLIELTREILAWEAGKKRPGGENDPQDARHEQGEYSINERI